MRVTTYGFMQILQKLSLIITKCSFLSRALVKVDVGGLENTKQPCDIRGNSANPKDVVDLGVWVPFKLSWNLIE